MRIGDFARSCGLTIETLYHYESLGLLCPAAIDPDNGYRVYEAWQLPQVNRILALKDAGFSLREIAGQMKTLPSTHDFLLLLEEKTEALETHLRQEQARLDRLRRQMFLIRNGGYSDMQNNTIKQVEAICVAGYRKQIQPKHFDSELESMWQAVHEDLRRAGIRPITPCLMIYHRGWEQLGPDERLEVEVIEPLPVPYAATAPLHSYCLPPARMASAIHQGPFSTFGQTLEKLRRWIAEQGLEEAGPMREIYHKGEWATEDPEEYITEIQIPLA